MQRTIRCAAALGCVFLGACGSNVNGHTYHANGGVVQVEFASQGKAYVSSGSVSHTCNYSESGRTVHLTCAEDTTNFIVQDDGALTGPPDGPMSRLTPLKD